MTYHPPPRLHSYSKSTMDAASPLIPSSAMRGFEGDSRVVCQVWHHQQAMRREQHSYVRMCHDEMALPQFPTFFWRGMRLGGCQAAWWALTSMLASDSASMGLVVSVISSLSSIAMACMMWRWSKVWAWWCVVLFDGLRCCWLAGDVVLRADGVAGHVHVGSGTQWGCKWHTYSLMCWRYC